MSATHGGDWSSSQHSQRIMKITGSNTVINLNQRIDREEQGRDSGYNGGGGGGEAGPGGSGDWSAFSDVFMVSALSGDGISSLKVNSISLLLMGL